MKEVWRYIKGYEGLYQVSSIGNVRSLERETRQGKGYYKREGKVLKPSIGKDGYLRVHLSKDGKKSTVDVHRLVAIAFIPNEEGLPCVNHKDENKTNNVIENLEWCSYSYNNRYGNGNTQRTNSKKETWKYKLMGAIEAYDKDGNFIALYRNLETASKILDIPKYRIKDCLEGKNKSVKGIVWKYFTNFAA